MRANEFLTNSVEIPIGRKGRATTPAPDVLYHSLRKRKLGPNKQIQGYALDPREAELQDMWVEPSTDGYVWLSVHPLDMTAVSIDTTKLDPNNLRYTGQSEGYILHKGSIPAEAIFDDTKLTELKKFSHTGQGYSGTAFPGEQWRGPHQNKELQMMLDKVKPAAILNHAGDLEKWKPYIDNGTFIVDTFWEYGKVGGTKGYVVGLPGEEFRLKKLAQLLGTPRIPGSPPPPESYHVKLGRLLGYDKGHVKTFLDKTRQFREDAGNMQTFYHVTLTKSVPSIKKKGICLLQTTNWTKGTGERYGNGNIFAFDTLIDAIRWAGKWDWDQNANMGTGKVSIITFKADPADWTEDPAEDFAKMSAQGKWCTSDRHVPPQNIVSVTPVTSDVIKGGVIKTTEAKINAVGKEKGKLNKLIPLHGDNIQYDPSQDPMEELLATLKNGKQVWLNQDKDFHAGHAFRTYHIYDPKLKKTVLSVTGQFNPKSKNLSKLELASSKDNTIKAHDFYHWLITNLNISLEALDQSVGAKKVWQKLGKKKGVNIHGWKKGEPVNVTPDDEEDAYYDVDEPGSDSSVANMSLIAHKK